MRALILAAGACLAVAACGDQAPDPNGDNAVTVETVPDDGNWVEVNTEAANDAQGCDHRKCQSAPDAD